ncbi:MAG: rod shape-determining protein MreC [Bacteroidales bacterium]|nr:rod shape-determining protein MreC [Bacteroidales bacterium]
MRSLLRFIVRFNFVIIFIIIEFASLSIAFQYNQYQKAGVVSLVQNINGFYHSKIFSITEYLNLRETNEILAKENARLNNILEQAYRSDDIFFYKQVDADTKQQYYMTSAKIINNSVNKKHNYLTLNKGTEHGVRREMAVVSSEGVVGVIFDVSKKFSTVISLLNTNLKISAKIKKNGNFGSLAWDGKDYRHAILSGIPFHVNIEKGDTIATSGYSSIFPENIQIGVIEDYTTKSGNFYEINVRLSTNFKRTRYINIISNLSKNEQLELENSFPDD